VHDLTPDHHCTRRRLACAAGLLAALSVAPHVLAQAPAIVPPEAVQTPVELRFDIARYRVEGNTLLPAEESEKFRLMVGDFNDLPLDDGMVDTAILHQVLHYAPAPDRVVAEVARVLAPDGVLMIVDFAPHDLEELRTRAAHARLGFSDDQIMAWFAQNGVELTAVEALSGSALTVKIWMGCQRHARVRSIREATGTFR